MSGWGWLAVLILLVLNLRVSSRLNQTSTVLAAAVDEVKDRLDDLESRIEEIEEHLGLDSDNQESSD